jgi:hypothetical protein
MRPDPIGRVGQPAKTNRGSNEGQRQSETHASHRSPPPPFRKRFLRFASSSADARDFFFWSCDSSGFSFAAGKDFGWDGATQKNAPRLCTFLAVTISAERDDVLERESAATFR